MNAKERLDKVRFMSQQILCLLADKDLYEKLEIECTAIKYTTEITLNDIKELVTLRQQLSELIERLPNQTYITVLRLRYFGGFSWRSISDHLHFENRYIMEIHKKALSELDALIRIDELMEENRNAE